MLLQVMLRLGFSVVSDAERYPAGNGITSGSITRRRNPWVLGSAPGQPRHGSRSAGLGRQLAHNENVLIDTPELVWESLNSDRVAAVDAIFLTHFHAGHTVGLRVLKVLGIEDPPVTEYVRKQMPLLLILSDVSTWRVTTPEPC